MSIRNINKNNPIFDSDELWFPDETPTTNKLARLILGNAQNSPSEISLGIGEITLKPPSIAAKVRNAARNTLLKGVSSNFDKNMISWARGIPIIPGVLMAIRNLGDGFLSAGSTLKFAAYRLFSKDYQEELDKSLEHTGNNVKNFFEGAFLAIPIIGNLFALCVRYSR